jgi:uncharacterized protein YecT (DUF1311 family)
MIKHTKILLIIGLTISSYSIAAVDGDTRPYEYTQANDELNSTYRLLLTKLNSEKQLHLRKAQKAWIKLREFDCKWAEGAQPLDCLIDRTDSRTKELKDILFEDKNGKYGTLEY